MSAAVGRERVNALGAFVAAKDIAPAMVRSVCSFRSDSFLNPHAYAQGVRFTIVT